MPVFARHLGQQQSLLGDCRRQYFNYFGRSEAGYRHFKTVLLRNKKSKKWVIYPSEKVDINSESAAKPDVTRGLGRTARLCRVRPPPRF